MASDISGYKFLGQGYSVVPLGRSHGVAKNVADPKGVLALLTQPEKLKETIIITPGGTTTFLAPLLYRNIGGIITYAGTPESHLGIVGRNFRVPIIMTLKLKEDQSIPDGTSLLMDCQDKIGYVYMPVKPGPAHEAAKQGAILA